MFQNLELFKTAMSMAQHAGLKQALTSRNIANADTPAYRPYAVKDFADYMPAKSSDLSLKATRPQHSMQSQMSSHDIERTRTNGEPNGNAVVLENEILNSVDAKRQHDRALAIYRASLGMLRSTLSKQ
jgi:flagellar basal-body rod protein FlgB